MASDPNRRDRDRCVVELTDSDSDDSVGPPPRPPVPPKPPRHRTNLGIMTETTVIDLADSSDDEEPVRFRPPAAPVADATASTSRPAVHQTTSSSHHTHEASTSSRKRYRTSSAGSDNVPVRPTVAPAPVPSLSKDHVSPHLSKPEPQRRDDPPRKAADAPDTAPSSEKTSSPAHSKRPRLDGNEIATEVIKAEAPAQAPVTRTERMVIAVGSESEEDGDGSVRAGPGMVKGKARAPEVVTEVEVLEEHPPAPPAPAASVAPAAPPAHVAVAAPPAPPARAIAGMTSSQRPRLLDPALDGVEDIPDYDDVEAAERATPKVARHPPPIAEPASPSRIERRPEPETPVAGPSKAKGKSYDNTWFQDLLPPPSTSPKNSTTAGKQRTSPKRPSPGKWRPETGEAGQAAMMREWFAPRPSTAPGKSLETRKLDSPEGRKRPEGLDLSTVPPKLDGVAPLFTTETTAEPLTEGGAPETTKEASNDVSTTAPASEATTSIPVSPTVPTHAPPRVNSSPSRKTGMMSSYRPTMRGGAPDASRKVSGSAPVPPGSGTRSSPTGKGKSNLAEAAKRMGFESSADKAAGGPVGKVLATMKQVIPANEGLTGGKEVVPVKKNLMGWAPTAPALEKQPSTSGEQEGKEAEKQKEKAKGKEKEKEAATVLTTTSGRKGDVVVVEDERARSTSDVVPGGAPRKPKPKKELTLDRKMKNLEWLRAPLHQRALTGPERPLEFNAMVQHTYLTKNFPPITTKVARSMLKCLIEEDQGRTNPDAPGIRIVGDGEIFSPPLEFVYTDRVVYRKGVPAPVRPDWSCDCFGDCADNPSCKCRQYQQEQVRRVKVEDLDTSDFEGFAYDVVPQPRDGAASGTGAMGHVPPARLKKEVVDFCLPIFECNGQCGCGPECTNRLIGRGRRTLMALKKTAHRGWGVFADQKIKKGDFLVVYSGELLTVDEAERRGEMYDRLIQRTYIFDLDPHWIRSRVGRQDLDGDGFVWLSDVRPKSITTGGSRAAAAVAGPKTGAPAVASTAGQGSVEDKKPINGDEDDDDGAVEAQYAVDAFHYGNIARFFNHRCAPNVSIIPAYIDEGDIYKPLFAFCAAQDVEKGTELTVSYSAPPDDDDAVADDVDPDEVEGEPKSAPNQVAQRAGKKVECMCGAPNCRGVMFS